MKLGIAAHCTIDSIVLNDLQYDVAGGPACYAAFTAKNLKFDVDLYTKFGIDFPLIEQLGNFNITKNQSLSETKTTRFKILLNDSDRKLFIENKCQEIEFIGSRSDGLIISPVSVSYTHLTLPTKA